MTAAASGANITNPYSYSQDAVILSWHLFLIDSPKRGTLMRIVVAAAILNALVALAMIVVAMPVRAAAPVQEHTQTQA
jgi:hypothetical protein